jgi:hypothetical protein
MTFMIATAKRQIFKRNLMQPETQKNTQKRTGEEWGQLGAPVMES